MYFLIDIKEHLKLERFTPNKKFFEHYKKYAQTPYLDSKMEAMN